MFILYSDSQLDACACNKTQHLCVLLVVNEDTPEH